MSFPATRACRRGLRLRRWAVRTTCTLTLTTGMFCSPASSQIMATGNDGRSCPDAYADVYLMRDAAKYPEGLPPGMPEGLPKQHLHLPRAFLQLTIRPGDSHAPSPSRLCDQKAFAAIEVFYSNTKDLAQRFRLPYGPPSPDGDQLKIAGGLGPTSPIDDSYDREGMAHKGFWVFDNKRGPYAAIYYFCVPPLPGPPSIHGPCYATADTQHMGYDTGDFVFFAQPFLFTTFYEADAKKDSFLKVITPDSLESYFAFLRALAAVVIVDQQTFPQK